jgi:hypothetical protein
MSSRNEKVISLGDYMVKKEIETSQNENGKVKILEAIYSIQGSKIRPSYGEYDENQQAERHDG